MFHRMQHLQTDLHEEQSKRILVWLLVSIALCVLQDCLLESQVGAIHLLGSNVSTTHISTITDNHVIMILITGSSSATHISLIILTQLPTSFRSWTVEAFVCPFLHTPFPLPLTTQPDLVIITQQSQLNGCNNNASHDHKARFFIIWVLIMLSCLSSFTFSYPLVYEHSTLCIQSWYYSVQNSLCSSISAMMCCLMIGISSCNS